MRFSPDQIAISAHRALGPFARYQWPARGRPLTNECCIHKTARIPTAGKGRRPSAIRPDGAEKPAALPGWAQCECEPAGEWPATWRPAVSCRKPLRPGRKPVPALEPAQVCALVPHRDRQRALAGPRNRPPLVPANGLLLTSPDRLDPGDQARLAAVKASCPHLDALGGHVRSFAEMMTRRPGPAGPRRLAHPGRGRRPARTALFRQRHPPRPAGRYRRAGPTLQLRRYGRKRQQDQDDQTPDVRPRRLPAATC
jgi:hypothetical protein